MNAKSLFTLLLLLSTMGIHAENHLPFAPATFCLACDVPSGLQVISVSGDSATLSWNAVAGAGQYTLEVEDEQNNPSTFHLELNVTGTSHLVTGLQSGVLYKFKVRARCGGDKSDWSDWLFFNAASSGNGGGGSGSGPCAIPAQLSAVVAGGVATLSWSAIPGATQYYIEVEDEQNQPSNFHLELAVQDTFYVLNNLQAGVLYKFKVRTHCGNNQSDWSTWVFFNGNTGGGGPSSGSGSCDRPTFLQITNLTLNSALLTWNPAPGISSYTLEIEKESGAPWQTTQVVNTNSYQVNGLEPNTRYKYKVRSNCPGGGHSSWTKWKKFKTPNSFTGTAGGAGLTNNKVVEERELVTNNTSAIDMAMRLFPNPSSTEATLTFEAAQDGEATIRVFDMAGLMIWNQTVQAVSGNTNTLQLPSVHFQNGYYLVQVRAGVQTQLMKWVVAQ